MSFASLSSSSFSESTLQAGVEVQEQAQALNIPSNVLSSITAVLAWREFLTTPSEDNRKLLLSYLQAGGFIPKSKTNLDPLFRAPEDIIVLSDLIVTSFADGSSNPADFLRTSHNNYRTQFPEVSKQQFQLLRSMLEHQTRLDELDVVPAALHCPFPITQNNYFGRFLAGGCDTPQKASRHLQIAYPFLVNIKNLIEGLQNDSRNYLEVAISSSVEDEYRDNRLPVPEDKRMTSEERIRTGEIIHAAINNASDLFGTKAPSTSRLRVISVPRIPTLNCEHIDRTKNRELAVAVFDWLFFDKKESPLLTQKSLSPSLEREARLTTRKIQHREKKIEKLAAVKPSKGPRDKENLVWQSEVRACKEELSSLRKSLNNLEQKRSRIVPLIEQLDAPSASRIGIKRFRDEISAAQLRGEKLVFSCLTEHGESSVSTSVFYQMLESAYVGIHNGKSACTKLLKSSAMLLTPQSAATVLNGKMSQPPKLSENRLRKFGIDTADLNISAQLVFSGVLPKPHDPQLMFLIDTIARLQTIPGVHTATELQYLVQQASRRTTPKAEDYINYLFERAPAISQDQLHRLFQAMYELDVKELPERALVLAKSRFRHPESTIEAYTRYAEGYRPQRLGRLPEVFANLASFEDYTQRGLDSLGVAREVNKIQEHLVESGIVAIVDGTNYHPELNVEVGATGDTLEKEDSEKTTEVWGEYVQPSERVIRALGVRLVEGDIHPELRNSSLVGVAKPDKVSRVFQKIIKKFYGIDIDIEPDLSQINHVLADLKTYDDNVILVLDARNISKLEEYQKFIDLLTKYGIKIILRTREPFPGIPQVNIQAFLDHKIVDRVLEEGDRLHTRLNVPKGISRDVVQFATDQVSRCRQPQADPLNLVLQVLYGAASYARLKKKDTINERHVNAAIPPIFHLLDAEQMNLRIEAIESFKERAPLYVMGQSVAINRVADRIITHMLALRDPSRPLTLLLPGPTGVGKTELLLTLAKICDLPFFAIEGAEFSEPHSVARLVGSPNGYVGPDEGILYKFLKENIVSLIFVDEIEKMHSDAIQALMNFWDKATLTAGNGKLVSRPGSIIVGASNAGADRLTADMETTEVKAILAEAFKNGRDGRERPELVGRFEPIVMPGISEIEFRRMLTHSLTSIGQRHGFINANLRLRGVDEVASALLFERCKDVCAYQKKEKKLGFGKIDVTNIGSGDTFYDLRHVSRAIDDLVGDSLRKIVISQHKHGATNEDQEPVPVILAGDLKEGRIVVKAAA